jgi:two-component system invasion response regulator UvrY
VKKFLLVDDHVVVRSGVKILLSQIFNPSEIDEAGDGDTVIELLKHHQYDLIIMDIQMPKTDTLGLMEYILIKFPDTKVLMFSMSAENIYAKRFLKAGACGFVSKDASLDEITKAINQVLNNKKYISPALASRLAEESFFDNPRNPFDKLSRREFEIASLLLSGQTLSEIAQSLNLQISTVGTHKGRLFEKLNVSNILELKELATTYNL